MADVTIYGAGIFGLSIGWSCVTRGVKVRIIEKSGIGFGSSGSLVGALSPHTPDNWNTKKQFQFESLMMSKKYWTNVEYKSGRSTGFLSLGRLQSIQDQRQMALANERVEGAKTRWEGNAVWSIVDGCKFGEWKPLSKTGLYIYDNLSASITPSATLFALAEAIIKSGSEIIMGTARDHGRVWYAPAKKD
jgi:glycine/D-amino acid oxidase-like deaminating enzyme